MELYFVNTPEALPTKPASKSDKEDRPSIKSPSSQKPASELDKKWQKLSDKIKSHRTGVLILTPDEINLLCDNLVAWAKTVEEMIAFMKTTVPLIEALQSAAARKNKTLEELLTDVFAD